MPEPSSAGDATGLAGASSVAPNRAQWRVLLLLVLSALLNYIDRSSLAVAAPLLSRELNLNPAEIGILLSAFFWSYSASVVPAGWIVDRYNVNRVLGIGLLAWGLATFATGFVTGFAALLALRLLLGIGESFSYPAYAKIVSGGFPVEQRGLPNALIDAGAKMGPALGTLIGGLLMAHYGWRMLFIALGAGSLLWLAPWSFWPPRPRQSNAGSRQKNTEDSPGLPEILRCRDAWGTFIGNLCQSYAFFFLLTWLPSYLVQERHLSVSQMAVLGSVPFLASSVFSVLGGWLSDRWIERGASPTIVRKTFVGAGLVACTVMVPAATVSDLKLSMALMIVANAALGVFCSNHWAISQALAGPKAAGRWAGLQVAIASLGGVISPWVTGLIVSRTGSFYLAFLSAAIIALAGAGCYLFVVRKVEPIDWSARRKVVLPAYRVSQN